MIVQSDSAARDLELAAVAEIAHDRAVIEQAKGMLILVYGHDDDAAFDILRQRSQFTNIKLRVIAKQLVADYRMLSDAALPGRSKYDTTLLSVHERIATEN